MDRVVLVLMVVIIGLFLWMNCSANKGVSHFCQDKNCVPMDYDGTFLPDSQDQDYFQNDPPSLRVENNYHRYIEEDCGGDYGNYRCRQKAYIKTMKDGTFDKADLMCQRWLGDEDQYYNCLDAVYGNYLFMDRFTGVEPRLCPNQTQGASRADGCSYCPKMRPLEERNPV